MFKILIHSTKGTGSFVVNRLQKEGHDVTLFISNEQELECCDGMVNKIYDLDEIDEDTDVIFFDDVDCGEDADALKKKGFLVIGASKFNDKIENDRKYGFEIMKKMGIQIPPTYDFDDLDEGIEFIKDNPDRYVIKVDDAEAKYTSHVGKDAEDMINVMTHMRDKSLVEGGFILQKFVDGYEISTEGWFNGKEFIPGLFIHDIEQKKFLAGDLGPTTGCEGSILFGGKHLDEELVANLVKMTPILKKYSYKGAIDLNVIKDKKGNIWALEFCGRVGYICLENWLELFDGDFGELLYDVASGGGLDYELSDDICIGVNISVPPYPVEFEKHLEEEVLKEVKDVLGKRCYGIEVSGFEDFEDSCYFSWIMRDEEDNKIKLVTKDGYIGAVCARSSSIDKCQTIIYDRLDKINLPSKQYRIDIGDRAKEWFKEKGRIIDDKKLSEESIAPLSIRQKMEMQHVEIENTIPNRYRRFSRGF
jgi:phosphoribosylamine--glycine ligase